MCALTQVQVIWIKEISNDINCQEKNAGGEGLFSCLISKVLLVRELFTDSAINLAYRQGYQVVIIKKKR